MSICKVERKRINILIAIVGDIEKTQIAPTNEMLLALFGQHKIVKYSKTNKGGKEI